MQIIRYSLHIHIEIGRCGAYSYIVDKHVKLAVWLTTLLLCSLNFFLVFIILKC